MKFIQGIQRKFGEKTGRTFQRQKKSRLADQIISDILENNIDHTRARSGANLLVLSRKVHSGVCLLAMEK
jgi:hypothetical protein